MAIRRLKATDYYPFGMQMVGRTYRATTGYRYGFNGKENDNDVKGIEGSQQDYGMRIYDPRIGKFLSVDPLTKDYPWYTPYQFAGNKPINSVDLDGLEELEVLDVVNPQNGRPGSARLTITLNYNVVTQGVGAVTNHNQINPVAIRNRFDRADGVFRMRNLPTAANEAVFLTNRENRWARKAEKGNRRAAEKLTSAGITYFNVNVDYNVTVTVNPNVTLADAQNLENQNPRRNGVVMNLEPSGTDLGDPGYTAANDGANVAFAAVAARGEDAEGFGLRFTTLGLNRELNLMIMNPARNHNGYTTNVTHEAGHNMTNQGHQGPGGNYEYNQGGLQSNSSPSPSKENTRRIINDPQNRSAL